MNRRALLRSALAAGALALAAELGFAPRKAEVRLAVDWMNRHLVWRDDEVCLNSPVQADASKPLDQFPDFLKAIGYFQVVDRPLTKT